MSAPLISVIIPCHNYGRYVGEAIESLIRQTYPHWEALIIDDGSSDDTGAVVAAYCQADPRVRYQYQAKQGVSAARNAGFALTTGEYIQLLDADDLLAERKFELQLALFAQHPAAALVYGDAYSFDQQAEVSARTFSKFVLRTPPVSGGGGAMALHLLYDNIFLISSPLFKRSLLTKLTGFNQAIAAFEDWEFWYRAALQGAEFVYDATPGTEFYVRGHGSNTTTNRHKMWQSKLAARKSIMQLLEEMIAAQEKTSFDLQAIWHKHQALHHEESARFNMLYASVVRGLADTVRYSLKGEKPLRIWYDSAYWLKERLLSRKK